MISEFTCWESIKLRYSRNYVHTCLGKINESLLDLRQSHLPSAKRIDHPRITYARRFFKTINQDLKETDVKVQKCFDLYRATALGIKSVAIYQADPDFKEFSSKPPLERYLVEHNHELKEEDGELKILYQGSYQPWKAVFAEYKKMEPLKSEYPGKPIQEWKYGQDGVQKKDMYSWNEFTPYKKDDPEKWGRCYIFEFCVTCTDAQLRTSGDHSWFRLKDPQGNVYSVGKNLAAKIEKQAMFPFRMRPGFLMSPDVSDYWPQPVYRLPVQISEESFYEIIKSVNEDKRNEKDMTFQVFNGNCQEYVNEKARIAGIQLPTRHSVARLMMPQFLVKVYNYIVPSLPEIVQNAFHAIGAFFLNVLLAILGDGAVDSKLKDKKVTAHLSSKDLFNLEMLHFHPPTYVAQGIFPEIEAWRIQNNSPYDLPEQYYLF